MKKISIPLFIFSFCFFAGIVWGSEQSRVDLQSLKILDLQTARRIALADNPGLKASLARIEQAVARVKQAEAAWWPTLDLSGGASRVRLSDSNYDQVLLGARGTGVATDQDEDRYSAGLSTTWILFDGFRRKFSIKAARFEEDAEASDHKNSRRLLTLAVDEAYLNTQLADSKVDIAKADSSFFKRQLHDAVARNKAGTGSLSDVLNIRVQINAAKTELLLSLREREATLYGLAALMGVKNGLLPEKIAVNAMDEKLDVRRQPDPESLITLALTTRPDILKAELQIKQLKAALKQAGAPFYPNIMLDGGLNGSRIDDFGMSGDDIGSHIGINMKWNLFRGGADDARRVEIKARRRDAQYRLSDLQNKIISEVRRGVTWL